VPFNYIYIYIRYALVERLFDLYAATIVCYVAWKLYFVRNDLTMQLVLILLAKLEHHELFNALINNLENEDFCPFMVDITYLVYRYEKIY